MSMDMQKILQENKTKKLVIFGAGAGGRVVLQECRKYGFDAAYFVDNAKKGTVFENKEVKDPYELMYEEENHCLILISACRKSLCMEITRELEGMGFQEGKDFFTPSAGRNYAAVDLFDPLLGYARKSEKVPGFFVTEGKNISSPKILVLGGSTSDPTFGNITSWVEIFAEKLAEKGYDYSIYNGAVAGYCANQELLKFLRDALPLSPRIVITMDGFNDASQPRNEEHPFYHPYQIDSLGKMFANIQSSSLEINGEVKGMSFGINDTSSRQEFYLRTLKALHGAAEENKILHLAFLQPNSSLETHSGFPALESIKAFYRSVLENKPDFMVDASTILENTPEAYMDYAHYSSKGNRVIAEFVLAKLQEICVKKGFML